MYKRKFSYEFSKEAYRNFFGFNTPLFKEQFSNRRGGFLSTRERSSWFWVPDYAVIMIQFSKTLPKNGLPFVIRQLFCFYFKTVLFSCFITRENFDEKRTLKKWSSSHIIGRSFLFLAIFYEEIWYTVYDKKLVFQYFYMFLQLICVRYVFTARWTTRTFAG